MRKLYVKWTEEVRADRHCVWMVRVLSSQCPETVREVYCGGAGQIDTVWMVRVLSSQCPETVREVDCGRGA